ncbi:MAG: hypothetical protein KDC10_13815, partial [Calditrichaeota bacterium]|nr:hypothetical protein [Calditrichota bacterium]
MKQYCIRLLNILVLFLLICSCDEDEQENLVILSPSESTVWIHEEGIPRIRWKSDGVSRDHNLMIELEDSAENRILLTSNATNNNGSWYSEESSLPENLDLSLKYHVVITSAAREYRSAEFSILARLRVEIVNESRYLLADGRSIPVVWNVGDSTGTVSIELKISDYTSIELAQELEDHGLFLWEIADSLVSNSYRTLVVNHSNGTWGESSLFYIARPIKLVIPDEDTVWRSWWEPRIEWETGNLGDDVRIILLHDNIIRDTLATRAYNDGEGYFSLPEGLAEDSTYSIRMEHLLSGSVSISPQFTILERFEITVPNEETLWFTGDTVDILWEALEYTGHASISLYQGNQNSVEVIADSVSFDSGFYQWEIRATLESRRNYRIRIRPFESGEDVSSSSFTISEPPAVTQPESAVVWQPGEHWVRWAGETLGGAVRIELLQNGILAHLVTPSASNSGMYEAFIPITMPMGDYQVRVRFLDHGIEVLSEEFTITGQLTITEPNSATVWRIGMPTSIRWITGGMGGLVTLELHHQSSIFMAPIANQIPNTGVFDEYVVPQDLPPETDYVLKIIHSSGGVYWSPEFSVLGQIAVLVPNQETVWANNLISYPISWDTGLLGGLVEIGLLRDGIVIDTLGSLTHNDGSFLWVRDEEIEPDSTYQILVDHHTLGESSLGEEFRIVQGMTITSPDSDAIWELCQHDVEIQWDPMDFGGTVSLTLMSSPHQTVIAEGILNTGIYVWTVPCSNFTSPTCWIR